MQEHHLKGLVLSGGKGTRLRPLTYTGAKQLVPLANKPVLFYVLEDIVQSGIRDIGIVVGDTGDQVRAAVGDGSRFGCSVTYIDQPYPGGLAHALKISREFLGEHSFVMYLGDNFIEGGIRHFVEDFVRSSAPAHILLAHVPNPEQFGVVELVDGRVVNIEEKPQLPTSDLAMVGIYLFRPEIHAAVAAIQPSGRGELEIVDAISELMRRGAKVVPHVLEGWWIDTGRHEDMLEANRLVLLSMRHRIEGQIADDCVVQGIVVVEPGARVCSSTLRGPLIIGEGTTVEHSYVGPFTAIGRDCRIQNSEIEHTIVMERTSIIDAPVRLEDSLIGRDVTIVRSYRKPRGYKVTLGDHSRIDIP